MNQSNVATWLLSPAVLGMLAVAPAIAAPQPETTIARDVAANNLSADTAIANDAIEPEANELAAIEQDQVTSVSQLTDVRPTDWAFQALQSLVERYGCIAGYPAPEGISFAARTYRGNRALSRYEFAAGLNACMDRINELIAAATADLVKKEDLATLQKLQEEFSAELATLRGRVDALEARTATLEKQQFSTTTKLSGEVVLALGSILSSDTVNGVRVQDNTVVGDRIRLNFDTSFNGEDLLRTRLQATNFNAFSSVTNTPEGDYRFAGAAFASDNSNSVAVDALLYQFKLGKATTIVLEANAGAIDDFTNPVNPFFDGDGGSGALSHFATRNPIYYLANGTNGTGIGIRHEFGNALELSLGYLAADAANPQPKAGLFDGSYGAIAQLTVKPSDRLALGFTYINGYNTSFIGNGSTGSNRANLRSALLNNPNLPTALAPFGGVDIPVTNNAFGIQGSFQFSRNIVLNGSVGYTNVRTLATQGVLPRGELDVWNWSVGLAFPDLGKKGSVAGIIVGMEPKVTGGSRGLRSIIGRDRDTSLHIEGFYQYQLTDNIAITPGVIWLTAPDHDSRNDDLVIGTVRATFTF